MGGELERRLKKQDETWKNMIQLIKAVREGPGQPQDVMKAARTA